MMKSRVINFFLLAAVLLACAGPEARKPIVRKTSSFMNESIERNKVLNNLELQLLEARMQRDSLSVYNNSSQGFWYKYLVQMEDKSVLPETGDVVLFEYQIKDLRDSIVYSKEELGVKSYLVDKEEMISGLQDGIKLLQPIKIKLRQLTAG